MHMIIFDKLYNWKYFRTACHLPPAHNSCSVYNPKFIFEKSLNSHKLYAIKLFWFGIANIFVSLWIFYIVLYAILVWFQMRKQHWRMHEKWRECTLLRHWCVWIKHESSLYQAGIINTNTRRRGICWCRMLVNEFCCVIYNTITTAWVTSLASYKIVGRILSHATEA